LISLVALATVATAKTKSESFVEYRLRESGS
jgi:hypothetical protein